MIAASSNRLDEIGRIGLIVIVKVLEGPSQLRPLNVNVGVTVIVAVEGDVDVLVAIKFPELPVPVAAKPIVGLLFTHR